MKMALIMEGGAMRGLFTCGVLDVFLENDIRFDGAAGISAGAVLFPLHSRLKPHSLLSEALLFCQSTYL